MRTLRLLLILILLLSVSTLHAQEAIDIGDTVEDQLDVPSMDFIFEAELGTFLEINLSSRTFDTLLTVLNADEEEIVSDDDSGESTNSFISFIVPETGRFILRVSSYNQASTGDFVLRLRQKELTLMNLGESTDVKFDGDETLYFGFGGNAGQAVNIYVDSGGALDSVMVLKQNGAELARDDDSGTGFDPYIRQRILPAVGMYVVELSPLSGSELQGEATLTLEETQIASLDDEVTRTFTFVEENPPESLRFTAQANTEYLLSVSADEMTSLNLEVLVDDIQLTYVSATVTNRVSFVFKTDTAGSGIVRVTSSFYDEEDVEVQVKLERVDQ